MLIQSFTVAAPAAVETGFSAGRLKLTTPAAGELVANVNRDTFDGVPVSPSTKACAASFRSGRLPPTELDRSAIRATFNPHLAANVGFVRLSCQMPPDAALLVSPVEIMKSTVDR